MALFALALPTVFPVGPAAADEQSVLIGRWWLSDSILDANRPGFTCNRAGFAFAPDRYGYLVDGKMTVLPVLGYGTRGDYAEVTSSSGVESFQVINHDTIEFTMFSIRCRYSRLPN